jgi:hypothetical protein
MVIFHSYVKLPEDKMNNGYGDCTSKMEWGIPTAFCGMSRDIITESYMDMGCNKHY